MSTTYPNEHLVRLRLLQRYMSAGIMSLVISRGGFIVSLVHLLAGVAFIVVGRFFFWERYHLYGCRPDYTTSTMSSPCSPEWQREASGSVDVSTTACLVSGSVILVVALLFPYALLALKGNREETEEIRSIVHLQYHTATATTREVRQHPALVVWERAILRIVDLKPPSRIWTYFHHQTLDKTLARRRRFRRFAGCLWTEVFARIVLQEYTFPFIVCLLGLVSTVIAPCLMNESTALLRVITAFVSLVAYVAILVVSIVAFLVILIIDPTAWMGCLVFWGVYLTIHLLGFAVHKWVSHVPRVVDYEKELPGHVPASVLRAILNQLF